MVKKDGIKKEKLIKKKVFLFVILPILFIIFTFSVFMIGYTIKEHLNYEDYLTAKQLVLSNGDLDLPNLCYSDNQIPNILSRSNKTSEYIMSNLEDKTITLSFEDLNRSLYLSYVLPTGSMRPTISDNDTLILMKVESERDINIGDVISIELNSSNKDEPRLLHRVINIIHEEKGDLTYYVTKGDNNAIDDEEAFGIKVTLDMVRGKLVGIIY